MTGTGRQLRRGAGDVLAALRRWGQDREGLGAIEFALLLPLLLVIYLTAFELTIGISVAKRATSAASTAADLVTQQDKVNKAFLTTMADVSKAIFAPYATTGIKLKLTGIKVDSASKATVAWSWASDGTKPYSVNATVTLPAAMVSADTFLVHSELSIPHQLVMYVPDLLTKVQTITIEREYYYRQRMGTAIDCSDC